MWKIGDKAVCIAKDHEWEDHNGIEYPGPKYMELNIVKEVYHHPSGEIGLGFKRYSEDVYDQFQFRKLSEVSGEMSEEILTEVLTSIEEPVEV